ncbi:hypothetical protein [Coleofasciculus sp. FACHB-SPT36]|uniref:hypothetical protein n=1 Tax=Cyanophyceae TaxID=3028117 RepID=UPI00168B9F04|nr:hypothetical protein [Coleofasciculus sp. FACHB-SPT36]MBD2541573.1 hypothetical protein [Coleofasciculus sp. FACHB-SPT36]
MPNLGCLVVGIAYEINDSVNFIGGNLVQTNSYIRDLLEILRLYQQHYANPTTETQEKAEAIDLEFLIEGLLNLLNSMH